jgi:hypothetical protein
MIGAAVAVAAVPVVLGARAERITHAMEMDTRRQMPELPAEMATSQAPPLTACRQRGPLSSSTPFGGTGTTALVAAAYGRTGISVDMSGDYSRLARWRTTDPGERAKAMMVAKPPPVLDGQVSLFDMEAS